MDEFKFVIKCFIFSCLIVIFSQTRIQGETLENKALIFLQHSQTAHWIRAAADGGIKLIRQGTDHAQDFMHEKFGSEKDKTQQRGETAESWKEESNNEDRL